jgi:hypothetical protein
MFTVMIAVALLWRSEAGRLTVPVARPTRLPARRAGSATQRRRHAR